MPLLLVKQFAFDLEFLAVANALGFRQIREQPVTLDYRFTGSGVRSLGRASRARGHGGDLLPAPDPALLPAKATPRRPVPVSSSGAILEQLVSVLSNNPAVLATVDYPNVEFVLVDHRSDTHAAVAERASGDVLAFVDGEARPAGNWLSATTAFLGRQEIAAVVTSKVAPHTGSVRALAAAAVMESRVGCGSLYFRFTPGSLRFVNNSARARTS